MHRPINVLTVTSAIIHHVTHVSVGIWYVIILMTETPLGDVVGKSSCEILDVIGVYGLAYLYAGSLGIASFRILYIKHERWVKYAIGERLLLTIILLLSISVSGVVVFLYKLGRSNHRSHLNMCVGLSITESQILIEYELSHGIEMIATNVFQSITVGLSIYKMLSRIV